MDLKQMVDAELARRSAADTWPYAPEIVIHRCPDDDARVAAVAEKYPGKIVIVNEIVDSPMRHAKVPDALEGASHEPSTVAERIDDRSIDRAKGRLAALKGQF
jgi:hypothetical protein